MRRPRRQKTYPAGSCTRHVYDTVPWVPLGWGDALQWAASAHGAGLVVSDHPVKGAVAVWPHGAAAGPYGHVAVVVQVDFDGEFTVWQNSAGGRYTTEEKRFGPGSSAWFIHPPANTMRRLPAGVFGNGHGDSSDPIVQVAQSWNALTWYWDNIAFYQSLKIELLAIQINRL